MHDLPWCVLALLQRAFGQKLIAERVGRRRRIFYRSHPLRRVSVAEIKYEGCRPVYVLLVYLSPGAPPLTREQRSDALAPRIHWRELYGTVVILSTRGSLILPLHQDQEPRRRHSLRHAV